MAATAREPNPELKAVPAEEAPPAPPQKSRRNTILGIAAAVALVGGSTIWFLEHGRESTDDAQIDADVVSVPARVGGVALKVNFVENQRVKTGDVLAELDDAIPKAKLEQAEGQLTQAIANADAADAAASLAERNAVGNKTASRATLLGANVGEKTSAEQLQEGRAQLTSAEAQFTQSKQDVERARLLRQSNAMSQASLDQSETAFRLADSNLALAKARIATLQSSVVAARSRVDEATARAAQNADVSTTVKQARAQADAAQAQVKVAMALRDLAKLDLDYTKVIAPQDGIVSRRAIQPGQNVSPGQAIVQLVANGRWVTANYKETQVGDMRVGQPVKIEVDAFSGKDIVGQIESISGGTGSKFTLLPPDNASGNFTKVVQRVPVRIKLTHVPDGVDLRTGMNVEATVDTRGVK